MHLAAPARARIVRLPGVTWLSPVSGDSGLAQIDHTQSLLLRWSPGMGTLTLQIGTGFMATGSVSGMTCVFDATTGTGSIPAALMMQLPTNNQPGGIPITFRVSTFAVREVMAGSRHIYLRGSTDSYESPIQVF